MNMWGSSVLLSELVPQVFMLMRQQEVSYQKIKTVRSQNIREALSLSLST